MMMATATTIKDKAAEYPVRVGGLVLGILLFGATALLGDDAPAYLPFITLAAPVVTGFIVERLTFSRPFVEWVLDRIDEYNPDNSITPMAAARDSRLKSDAGQSAVVVLLIILVVIALIILLNGGVKVQN